LNEKQARKQFGLLRFGLDERREKEGGEVNFRERRKYKIYPWTH